MILAKANPLCYALAPMRSWVFDVELGALHAQKSFDIFLEEVAMQIVRKLCHPKISGPLVFSTSALRSE